MNTTANVISSRTNARVKQLRAAFMGNARLSGGLIAIEGATLVQEALRSGIVPRTVFLSAQHEAPDWLPEEVEVLWLADIVLASATDTRAPQGIAALMEPPAWNQDQVFANISESGPALLLVAAGLQDPGNLGTLIRTVEAFHGSAVLTIDGTVSPWKPKALRASAGSVFRVPVLPVTIKRLAGLRTYGIRMLAAVAGISASHRSPVPVPQVDLTAPCAFLIGNEGNGLTPELLAIADSQITIPMPGPVESLNAAVAGSLLLYEAARQRTAAGLG